MSPVITLSAASTGLPSLASPGSAPVRGYGRCSQCTCTQFVGSGWACARGGCNHHYDSHS